MSPAVLDPNIRDATLTPEFGGTIADGVHWLSVRVYYEDTDAEGIVYYANYLKFLERGRSEFLRVADLTSSTELEGNGIGYVIRRVELDYLRPARLDDLVVIKTWIGSIKGASMVMKQEIWRMPEVQGDQDVGAECLVRADIKVACLSLAEGGKPVRLPVDLKEFYEAHLK